MLSVLLYMSRGKDVARQAHAVYTETEKSKKLIWSRFRCTTTRAHVFRSFLSTHSGAHHNHYAKRCYRYGGNAAPYTPIYGHTPS